MAFADLKSAYPVGGEIAVADLPAATVAAVARSAAGATFVAELSEGEARFAELPSGTHAIEARAAGGVILAEEFTTVGSLGERPVMGFATSFEAARVPAVLEWLRRLRCTVVQVYDWMARYSAPLADDSVYRDPLGRALERPALERLIRGIHELGAVVQAYAPVPAADAPYADAHPDQRLYRGDGEPQRLGDLLEIMDPSSLGWQRHWLGAYGVAADALGFDGFHLDSYGYPRCALDDRGRHVSLDEAYAAFVEAVREARPRALLSFNQVNGVPRGFPAPGPPAFRYIEVWPPNDRWRHLEGLLARSAAPGGDAKATLALYPPVWSSDRSGALRTVLLTEAVVTALGASLLVFGDDRGVLCDPYYVDHERLADEEATLALAWRRFALRCRDLFTVGVDTSWTELADPNGAVSVAAAVPVSPEPVGGALFVRAVRAGEELALSLIDLSGSDEGSWLAPTARGSCGEAEVTLLVAQPGRWVAQAAVLGRGQDRFFPLETFERRHREGRAISCRVPLVAGWSVLRLSDGGG